MKNSSLKSLRVFLAQPRGFCAGVERAITIVERAIEIYGPPVYVRHEIVHNKRVVNNLISKGAIFVQELDQIPAGAVTVLVLMVLLKKSKILLTKENCQFLTQPALLLQKYIERVNVIRPTVMKLF